MKKKETKKNKNKKSSYGIIKKTINNYVHRNDEKTSFSVLEVIIIMIISILFGVIVGYLINYSRSNINKDSNLSKIITTYNDINNNYYGEIDKEKVSDAAVKSMVEALNDPYSNYISQEEASDFNDSIDGSFVGIGVEITDGVDYTTVIKVFENSPADKSGIKVNDQIIKVNGNSVKGLPGAEIAKLVRGKKKTKVTVTVLREEKEIDIDLIRDTVDLESVFSNIIETDGKKIGYINITSVAANTYSQFYKALKALESKKIDSLIIDVRDNPGGHLQQTKQILSLFFNSKTVLYQIKSNKNIEKAYSYSKETRKYPIAVLINGGSASASEIIASCFKENYKDALIIGTTTYGKGTVQKTQTFSNGTTIKYTTEKWLTSKGKDIDKKGVTPTVEVVQSEEYYANPIEENDLILKEALNRLKESN